MFKHTILLLFTISVSILNAQNNYNACVKNNPIHIVVLGSSTAAGSGPTSADSAWVNRYRRHIQSINSQNLVTNLGVGGTTTYNILPNWYVAPANRPSRDSLKNISQAIMLGADAVIINMPSNDAANGFSVTEQLANFRMIKNVADSFNIDLWVCTTQPRNFSLLRKKIQLDVRDSVFAQYGTHAIDFWNGFADTSHVIKSIYDSGDGVHMNNAAHGVLNQRVVNELIPNIISDTLSNTDIAVEGQLYFDQNNCGDSTDKLVATISNLGTNFIGIITMRFIINDITNATVFRKVKLKGLSLNACSTDTIELNLNTLTGVNYEITAYIDSIDNNQFNDTSSFTSLIRIGEPDIQTFDDVVCMGDTFHLSANTSKPSDTIVWYDSISSSTPIHYGNSLVVNPNSNQLTYYAESVRGNLHFNESFDASLITDVNWNGYMFNVIAKDSISIDSLEIPINTTGNQKVIAYYKHGTYSGFENTLSAWTYWGIDSNNISTAGTMSSLSYTPINISPNDTLAIYLYLQNSASTLSYKRTTTASTRGNLKLEIPSGSGISHTFGAIFYPRDFSGIVHYHYGFNPRGGCQSTRKPVSGIISQAYLDLGNDTNLNVNSSYLLSTNGNFNSYVWSTGDTIAQLLIDTSKFFLGSNTIWLNAIDTNGCINTDTIQIHFGLSTSLTNSELKSISISPNPSEGLIRISGADRASTINLFNLNGKLVFQSQFMSEEIDLSHLPKGIYHLSILNNDKAVYRKIILF